MWKGCAACEDEFDRDRLAASWSMRSLLREARQPAATGLGEAGAEENRIDLDTVVSRVLSPRLDEAAGFHQRRAGEPVEGRGHRRITEVEPGPVDSPRSCKGGSDLRAAQRCPRGDRVVELPLADGTRWAASGVRRWTSFSVFTSRDFQVARSASAGVARFACRVSRVDAGVSQPALPDEAASR